MKFREEVVAKIFTYITVILLLGIVIFEAWSLQGERSSLKEAKEELTVVHENLDTMIGANKKLQEENKELQIFQNTWLSYAAFVDDSEVLLLKSDLFTRPALIPGQAAQDALKRLTKQQKEQEEEQAEEQEETDGGKRTEKPKETEEEEEITLDLQFDNPKGEDVFFPISTDAVDAQSCLIYTAAFDKSEDVSVELIYELAFDSAGNVVRDDNGEVDWRCIAYNAGDGWNGVEGENDDDD